MANTLHCPACQFPIPGNVPRSGQRLVCPHCQVSFVIPGTSPTSRRLPVAAGQSPTTRATGRPRSILRIPPRRNQYLPLVFGGVLVAAAAGAWFLFSRKTPRPTPTAGIKKPVISATPEPTPATPIPTPPPTPPPPQETEPEIEYETIIYNEREYTVPKTFKKGARVCAGRVADMIPTDGKDREEVLALLREKKIDELLARAWRYHFAVLHHALSDDEAVARAAFEVLDRACVKYQLPPLKGEKTPTWRMAAPLFNDPSYRAGVVLQFRAYQNLLNRPFAREKRGLPPFGEDVETAQTANWRKLLNDLREFSTGGEGESKFSWPPDSPGARAIVRVQQMGPEAYPYLIKYILADDPQVGRAAVAALHFLTGYNASLPYRRADFEAAQKKWMENLGVRELPPDTEGSPKREAAVDDGGW